MYFCFGVVLRIMTTRTASIGWRWYVGVDNVNGAAKLHVGCIDNDLIVGFDMLVRLVCELANATM